MADLRVEDLEGYDPASAALCDGTFNFVLEGGGGVGKTHLANRWTGYDGPTVRSQATRPTQHLVGYVEFIREGAPNRKYQVVITDICGQEAIRGVGAGLNPYRRFDQPDVKVDGVVLLFDIGANHSYVDLEEKILPVMDRVFAGMECAVLQQGNIPGAATVPVVLLGNKHDGPPKVRARRIRAATDLNVPYWTCSCQQPLSARLGRHTGDMRADLADIDFFTPLRYLLENAIGEGGLGELVVQGGAPFRAPNEA